LHEDVNLVKKKPSPFRFDEKAWDRMKYFFLSKIQINIGFLIIYVNILKVMLKNLKNTGT
jgi:hypothetical protein